MSLIIRANNQIVLDCNQFSTDFHDLEFQCLLPMVLEFETNGKSFEDTLVDDQGKILQDKFIVVESMSVDSIWIKRWMLGLFENATSDIKTNYFGQNGIARFQIPYSDIMQFWLDTVTVDD
jgi:hypothetical protein